MEEFLRLSHIVPVLHPLSNYLLLFLLYFNTSHESLLGYKTDSPFKLRSHPFPSKETVSSLNNYAIHDYDFSKAFFLIDSPSIPQYFSQRYIHSLCRGALVFLYQCFKLHSFSKEKTNPFNFKRTF
jgi:hypothetical protein